MMLMSKNAGKLSLNRNMYVAPPGALLYLMITARITARRGASSKLINRYCLLLSFDNVSRVTKISVCFNLLGRLSDWGGASCTSSTRLMRNRSLNMSYHCGGVIFRLLVGCPYSSTTF